ncbi:hypothetical protein BJY01DRAFT_222619 [Aspergillus pseudoustus]|uniref:Uncharacterized protein n=1 Tax=Aspergillus pseudoustus TaxID=1810923 RepID=A0ABR4J7I7_9EURO
MIAVLVIFLLLSPTLLSPRQLHFSDPNSSFLFASSPVIPSSDSPLTRPLSTSSSALQYHAQPLLTSLAKVPFFSAAWLFFDCSISLEELLLELNYILSPKNVSFSPSLPVS